MKITATPPPASARQRALLLLALAILATLCVVVLRPFLVPMAWALILGYATWPIYRRMRIACAGRETVAALAMTLALAVVILLPVIWLAFLLPYELAAAYRQLVANPIDLASATPRFVTAIPWLGDAIQGFVDRYASDPQSLRQLVTDWSEGSHPALLHALGDVARNIAKFGAAVIAVFFVYRDGDRLAQQAGRAVNRFFGDRLDRYVRAAALMTRAVVFGFLVTAIVQGAIAGVGFVIFGASAPLTLSVLTTFASIVPIVGTGLVWGSVGLILALTGHVWSGLGLLAWGAILVHPADNLLRPLLITNATRVPFLVVMFGIIGGLMQFGLVGLFIGPVSLAVATAVWREWLEAC